MLTDTRKALDYLEKRAGDFEPACSYTTLPVKEAARRFVDDVAALRKSPAGAALCDSDPRVMLEAVWDGAAKIATRTGIAPADLDDSDLSFAFAMQHAARSYGYDVSRVRMPAGQLSAAIAEAKQIVRGRV